MKTHKDLALIGVFTALLISGQFALFAVSGIEIVTVLFASFAFYFGIIRGLAVATAFSLLRCLVFGFFPNVLILYLVYYNLFAVVIGLIGKKMNRTLTIVKLIIIVSTLTVLTILFTVLDNVITPLYYGMTGEVLKSYWLLSFTAMVPQTICTIITTTTLLPPLVKLYSKIARI